MILICDNQKTITLLRELGNDVQILNKVGSIYYCLVLNKSALQAELLRPNPTIYIDEVDDDLIAKLEAAIKNSKSSPQKFMPIEADVKHHSCSGCDVSQFCAKLKSSGKRENNSAVANHNGYAETKSSGKRENNSAENSPLTYAEMKDLLAFIDDIQANDKVIPCHDKTIVAVVTDIVTGHKFYGTNGIKIDNGYCPRNTTNDKVNQGYDKCVEFCGQESHAEIAAINKAIVAQPTVPLTHYKIDVYGTKQICDYCHTQLVMAGVSIGKVVNDLSQLYKEL